jgi:hypothetical protein
MSGVDMEAADAARMFGSALTLALLGYIAAGMIGAVIGAALPFVRDIVLIALGGRGAA